MPDFVIDSDIGAIFPDAYALALKARNVELRALASIAREVLRTGELHAARLVDGGGPASLPEIAVWRSAYSRAGVKPSKFRSSIEALVRQATKGEVRSVMPLVDLYNGISLKHLVPLGAVDAAIVPGVVEFRFCRPQTDSFVPLGGEAANFPLLPTVPVYATGSTVLCWCFNCRDAAPTALRTGTSEATFFTEGVGQEQLPAAMAALNDLATILGRAGCETQILRFQVQ